MLCKEFVRSQFGSWTGYEAVIVHEYDTAAHGARIEKPQAVEGGLIEVHVDMYKDELAPSDLVEAVRNPAFVDLMIGEVRQRFPQYCLRRSQRTWNPIISVQPAGR